MSPHNLPVPSLERLFRAHSPLGNAQSVGGLLGERRIHPILGERFSDEHFSGEVLPISPNWQVISSAGPGLAGQSDPNTNHFQTTPTFETASPQHTWPNTWSASARPCVARWCLIPAQ